MTTLNNCPKCKSINTKAYSSYWSKKGFRTRYMECKECSKHFTVKDTDKKKELTMMIEKLEANEIRTLQPIERKVVPPMTEHKIKILTVKPTNIFDMTDLSDIPANLLREITNSPMNSRQENVYSVLKESDEALTINELLVGIWRKHNVVIHRANLHTSLSGLIANGLAYKIGKLRGRHSRYSIHAPQD